MIGILARCDDRGIGNQTWEAWRHLHDASALVVTIDDARSKGFPQKPNRYVDAHRRSETVSWGADGKLDELTVRRWLDTIDVMYFVETCYDRRLLEWAREQGVATVCHVNPELLHLEEIDDVDVIWCPTPWRLDDVQARTTRPVVMMPYPVPTDRFVEAEHVLGRPWRTPRILHIAGHAAYGDRNGTKLVAAATSEIMRRTACPVLIASQDLNVPVANGALRVPPLANWWELYDFGDVLLMPRRFGGLCLPIQEAMAAGLGVVALDTEPHDWYGCAAIEAYPAGEFETGSGQVTIWNARPSDVAVAVEQCVADLPRRVERSRQWAELHSWFELEMMWRVGLATAIVKRER